MLTESAAIDRLEGRIIRCLQLAPRMPFAAMAGVLGVSEQTVARRYRRLRKDGLLRVTAVLNLAAVGQSNWIVRVSCRPTGAAALARALAQRDDVGWVTLLSGGTEIVCVLRARTREDRDDLLTQKLPRSAPVLALSAAMVLHRFAGGGYTVTDDSWELAHLLDDEETAAVLRHAVTPSEPDEGRIDPGDLALLDVLARDGRASHAALAAATGMSETRVARRLQAVLAGGLAYLDVDVPNDALGLHGTASIWLTAAPADLHRVGTELAAQHEVPFAAAITGPQNITASVVCRDVEALYRFVTDRIGAIAGVQGIEVSPVLRHVKQAGALTDGRRLAAT